jgi:HPt (histidine-containing phosphotransfer) domain-containing protein
MNRETSSVPALQIDVLQRLVGNDPDVIRGFLSKYLFAARQGLQKVASAVMARDSGQLRHLTHRLKGSSRTIGALDLAMTLERLEECAVRENWTGIDSLAEDLDRLWALLEAELCSKLGADAR